MKFKTNTSNGTTHKGTVTCLGWSNNDEVYSISDDHQLYKWNVKTREPIPVAKLPDDFFPTDLHWLPHARQSSTIGTSSSLKLGGGSSSSASSSAGDFLLITSSDGRFIILNKSARVERNIAAHSTAAITTGRWSPDGAGLLTAGEDGVVKVWSRSGMLRSTVIQNEGAIRCACWSPSSSAIAYCQAGFIAIKPLAANSKLTKWRAHDGMVLCMSWSNDTQYIASGGEDCRYKVWDAQGSIVYTSYPEDYAVTAVDFSPNGELLAVGGFNMLKLCNYTGWSHGNTKFSIGAAVGSLFSVCWSMDGTQVVAGTSSSVLVFGHVIEREAISRNLKAKTMGRKTMTLQDIATKTIDTLDFPDRVIHWNLGYEHLVVATTTQVHIYNQKYINTPLAVIDGRNEVRVIELGKKYFLIIDNASVWIYTYTGRLHLNPKYSGIQAHMGQFNNKTVSLGLHYLAIRDGSDQSLVRIFDMMPGATRQTDSQTVQNKVNIGQVYVSRAGNQEEQFLVFIDVNRDLLCTTASNSSSSAEIYKIGTQLISCMWGSDSNILVGLHDSCYSIWYCPGEACADPTIIALTTLTFDTVEFGKNVTLENFEGPSVTFKSSGALYTVQVNIFCEIMHRMLADDQWSQALKICRRCQNLTLWATLAAIASKRNQLEICEEAYSAALQVDKVDYLQHIKNLSDSGPVQMAENSIMMGRITEAETILLHNKNIPETVELLIRLHQWERALAIADSHPIQLERVHTERRQYLKALDKEEYSEKFLHRAQMK